MVEDRDKLKITRRAFLLGTAGVAALAACDQIIPATPTPEPTPTHIDETISFRERAMWHEDLAGWKLGNGKFLLEQFPEFSDAMGLLRRGILPGLNVLGQLKFRRSNVAVPRLELEPKIDSGNQVLIQNRSKQVLSKSPLVSNVDAKLIFLSSPQPPQFEAIRALCYLQSLVKFTEYTQAYLRMVGGNQLRFELESKGPLRLGSEDGFKLPVSAAFGYFRTYNGFVFDQYIAKGGYEPSFEVVIANWLLQDSGLQKGLSYKDTYYKELWRKISVLRDGRIIKVEDATCVWDKRIISG